MHRIMRTVRSVLLGAAGAAIFVAVAHGEISDSIRGAASEANHFIATPSGWVHPKTAWGEPDIQAMLNMMQSAGVPLERCAGNRNCDKTKAWLTDEEYNQRVAAARGRVDQGRALIEQGNQGTSNFLDNHVRSLRHEAPSRTTWARGGSDWRRSRAACPDADDPDASPG